jgi:murein DD-endopeptidase MepM/ murein hydrolase activator NlpD
MYVNPGSNIETGRVVNQGDIIGTGSNIIPAYGTDTPQHSHFEVRERSRGRTRDPLPLILPNRQGELNR